MTPYDPTDHVGGRLSGYIDGELTQQERQEVERHLADCAECCKLQQELTELRGQIRESVGREFGNDRFREAFQSSGNQMLSTLGWVALIAGALLLGVVIVISFVTDDSVSAGMKFLIGLPYLGLLLLFVAVLRRRLREARTDKYKDVEI
jgi:anti-sigma factor RsiW